MYNLNGEWNVRIQFLSGEAQHSLRFKQEGCDIKRNLPLSIRCGTITGNCARKCCADTDKHSL